MGTVWRARDDVLGREVAVKEVRAPAGLPASEVERLYTRLEREAWAAARIPYRNVVTVYDVATDEGRPWIVMELVRGLSLSDTLEAEGPMSPQRAAHIGAEVLGALRAAHDAGVLHRDVKPGNVLLSNDGRVVLTDFGIAMVEGSSALTMTGEVVGSPEFLAPERALGHRPGPESDLWSLGVLLYAAVEGVSPFRQNTPLSTLRAVVDEQLPPPRNAGPLTPVIEGLLRKDPAERALAADTERDLRLVAEGHAPRTESSASYQPTVAAPQRPDTTPPPPPPPGGLASSAPTGTTPTPDTTTTTPPARSRRTTAVLVAGIAAVALAIGGVTYALVNDDSGGGNGGADSGSGTTGGSNSGGGNGGSDSGAGGDGGDGGATGNGSNGSGGGDNGGTNGGGGDGGSTDGGGDGGTTTPAQSVRVSVTGHRTSYTGACPVPAGEAPSFAATFTVGRVPVGVQYRWVTAAGESSDPGWKTLSFPSDGGKSKQVNHVEVPAWTDPGTHRGSVRVEVRSPVTATSNSVAYSVTCEEEPPTTSEGSPSPYDQ
ncbi:serine/threonine-protein kinase [Streptomyces flavofungini]|uniref:serine/threonine-protein kinase n=1 Tax=Streptomyces flavofungini TaxID=68200 RepID=UPI0025B207FF|nr:serine/threonine-protein kinase [Streptomyces flavofungini]WJV49750.1 serine/threonine-protein kinase [Streptomyces flavofungini]